MQKELIEYIENMLQQGHSPANVKEAITKAGYSEEQATEAFQSISTTQETHKKASKAWMIMLGCVVLAIILTAAYLLIPEEKKAPELPEQYYVPEAPKPETCDQTPIELRDGCYIDRAEKQNDIEACKKMSEPIGMSACIGMIAAKQNNKAACETVPSKDSCYLSYSMTTPDPAICDLITDTQAKDSCLMATTTPPPIPEN